MTESSSFLIYNASAGSGKTFTLVKEYLKILFISKSSTAFKNILAITFTNKAAGEMKSRVIDSLITFKNYSSDSEKSPMFHQICKELNLSEATLIQKSSQILDAIIHNYAAFDISTIDGFTHKLIRTFAYDLKLPLNFEVELDTDSLLTEAVDRLISKAGTNKELTTVLVDYALEKADDDKSWDISKDLYAISKLLVNENDIPFLQTLRDKTLEDFKTLKNSIKNDLKTTENGIISIASNALTLIAESGLEHDDFNRKSLPRHFINLQHKNFQVSFDSNWQTDLIEGNKIYPARVSTDVASTIEAIQVQLAAFFNETTDLVFHYKFLQGLYRNITPLSVLNEIQKELTAIKDEKNVILISEFNTLISNEIKDQPTPFIYERFGERFKHYFIDEFQDTSVLQWKNLIPLIDNALSSENGSTMLVGDAKQAIYRWRGGKAEQFIDLFNKSKNPFHVEAKIKPLESNFRSFKNIIDFNNSFFNYLSETLFNKNSHKMLYKSSRQDIENSNNGFVELNFLDFENDDDKAHVYSQKVYETILDCMDQGFSMNDICVLVRKKKEGIAIAEFLSASGINIMSSETLLLSNSVQVRFINNILKLLIEPQNLEVKAHVLIELTAIFNIENKHNYLKTHIDLNLNQLFKSFEHHGYVIKYEELLQLSLYDLVETIVRDFNLVKESNAYVQYFMDVVLEFTNKQNADIQSFIDYFDTHSGRLSIVAPEGYDAVQIMTIHKSKGLEFPVVIFPFAELNIYREVNPQEWFPLNPEVFNGFSYALLNYTSSFENFGENGMEIFNKHQSDLELDNANLLYVALTRPIEQLYIISKKDISSKGVVNNNTFSGFFINYLQQQNIWDDQTLNYSFGEKTRDYRKESHQDNMIELHEFTSVDRKDNNIKIITNAGYLWDTSQKEAIEKGNLVHDIMALIKTKDDIAYAFSQFSMEYKIDKNQASHLRAIIEELVSHPQLNEYFNGQNNIYIERDIVSPNGEIIRPDRLVVFPNNDAVIIDYKSGLENKKHEIQLENYEVTLSKMTFNIIKKILIYINDGIHVKEF
ncbi:UvrD-helicase domain-containing protein [Hanstruepera ponticola]|uniref:UvrD-helicase domain-containing protein n=1 Tax=Hanstruepera ponticola TaxID=2042995 RepID=UPI000CF186EC|nr:UvrD-helicase domain-containing protein [Hanstruepera ponticola]